MPARTAVPTTHAHAKCFSPAPAGSAKQVKVACPCPGMVDVTELKRVFHYGQLEIDVVEGGLSCQSANIVPELGGCAQHGLRHALSTARCSLLALAAHETGGRVSVRWCTTVACCG